MRLLCCSNYVVASSEVYPRWICIWACTPYNLTGGAQTDSVCWEITCLPSWLAVVARQDESFLMILLLGLRGGQGIVVGWFS